MPPVIHIEDNYNLVATSSFPNYAFFPFKDFNPVQSAVFEIFNKECSAVLAARTSSGKTICAEMFISHEIHERGGKAMYLAPMRALAKEKIDDWTDPKHHFGNLPIAICTGDYRLTPQRKKEIEDSKIVIMTSEMLNSRTRNYKSEHNDWLQETGTVIVDESHLLTVPGRGDHLEVGLMGLSKIAKNLRVVFLSATMPNVDEIASWISYELTKKDTYLLDSKYRPCPLGIHYETYWDGHKDYEEQEEEKVVTALAKIEEYPEDKFLFFVHTKRTGDMMLRALKRAGFKAEFHNSDLEKDKRHALEAKFRSRELDALVATPTLAWGCYENNTYITFADGSLKKAKEVVEGDCLISFDFDKNQFTSSKVLRVDSFTSNDAWEILLKCGRKAIVSNGHEFYSIIEKVIKKELPKWNLISDLRKNDFVATFRNGKIIWSAIKDIKYIQGAVFREIEMEAPHTYVGGEMISHNCNLPARRVVIVGVHRGLNEVETYNIWQEVGRAGRVGLDPRGDAYILVPEKKAEYHIERLSKPQRIESRLLDAVGGGVDEEGKERAPHYKVLAFHIVSAIHHGEIKNSEDIVAWYSRSLAHFQNQSFDDKVIEDTLDLLKKCGAIIEENDETLTVTGIGKVSSMFYYSPFDVSDFKKNFNIIFKNGLEKSDYLVSMALGNIDSIRMGICSKKEREEMAGYAYQVRKMLGNDVKDTSLKGGYCYWCLMNGKDLGAFAGVARNLQFDFPRTKSLIQALDSMSTKWRKKTFFDTLGARVMYGVGPELVPLVEIPNIGAVRAKRLFNAGIRSREDFISNPARTTKALNMKAETVQKMIDDLKMQDLVGGGP